jgi:hypothetical protein
MALNLSTTGIVDGQIINAAQITQSINALTGTEAYNIIVSGSFSLTGGTTGSGTFNRSVQTVQVEPNTTVPLVDQDYNIAFFTSTSSVATPLKWSGTGPSFNPVTETLKVTNLLGTASYWSGFASQFSPSYTDITDITNPPANPYNVGLLNNSFVYINQTGVNNIGLLFPVSSQDGKLVTFTANFNMPGVLDYTEISLTASGPVIIHGINGQSTPSSATLNTITSAAGRRSFQFMYKTTPIQGWYYIDYAG